MGKQNKEETGEVKLNYYNSNMTLKPTQKIRRKNKKTKLQQLYNEGKVRSEEFYFELTKFIKWRLMTDLIRRGYYINGVRQNNFTRDECDACYTHVLHKILNEYSPERGTLATYVRWQIRGWGQLVIQKQVRNHKYNPQGIVSLDNPKIHSVKVKEYKNKTKLEDTEDVLDYEYFGNTLLDEISLSDMQQIREGIETIRNKGEFFEWLD